MIRSEAWPGAYARNDTMGLPSREVCLDNFKIEGGSAAHGDGV